MNKFEVISINQARNLAQQPGYIIVDLRSREEYDDSHVENAINIEDADMNKINEFNRKDLIWVLYCRRGSMSFRLANEMADNGYKVMTVVGGFKKE